MPRVIRSLAFSIHGEPSDVLELVTSPIPPIPPGGVLLKTHAAPINPADLNFIQGTYGIKPSLPSRAGMECCAEVVESRCKSLRTGDLVIPIARIGTWASHIVTDSEKLIKIPPEIDRTQASMLKVNPATAHLLLENFETLSPGDWVGLNASNSSVGQCVIQLAGALGVKTLCFLRNQQLAPVLSSLGADLVLPDTPDGLAAALDHLGEIRPKLAFNAVGGDSALRLLKLLAPGGTHITYGAMARKPLTIPNGPLIFADLRIRGLWVSRWIEQAARGELSRVYASLAGSVASGRLTQTVDSSFPLSDYQSALARLNSPERQGKVLFQFTP